MTWVHTRLNLGTCLYGSIWANFSKRIPLRYMGRPPAVNPARSSTVILIGPPYLGLFVVDQSVRRGWCWQPCPGSGSTNRGRKLGAAMTRQTVEPQIYLIHEQALAVAAATDAASRLQQAINSLDSDEPPAADLDETVSPSSAMNMSERLGATPAVNPHRLRTESPSSARRNRSEDGTPLFYGSVQSLSSIKRRHVLHRTQCLVLVLQFGSHRWGSVFSRGSVWSPHSPEDTTYSLAAPGSI